VGKVLVAVTWCSNAKHYVMPKFWEMLDACVRHDDVDILVLGDQSDVPEWVVHEPVSWKSGSTYAEDMLWATRDYATEYAKAGDYDVMVWHGVDALWQSRADFWQVLSNLGDVHAVAPLISPRNDSSRAIARRFIGNGAGSYSLQQVDIPRTELESGKLVSSGFPGADNIMISKKAFDIGFDGHSAWYQRVSNGGTNVCVEEYWVWRALVKGYRVAVDTSVKVWHVHEDLVARMPYGIEKPLGDITWL